MKTRKETIKRKFFWEVVKQIPDLVTNYYYYYRIWNYHNTRFFICILFNFGFVIIKVFGLNPNHINNKPSAVITTA